MAIFTSAYVASDDETIYYEITQPDERPDAPVVVLSHGAGGHHAEWFRQVLALSQAFRVVTWDSRGFGNSSGNTAAPSAEQASGDLAAVLGHAGIDDAVHLVGQSLGAWFAVEFALDHPDRAASIVMACSAGSTLTDELDEHWRAITCDGVPAPPVWQPVGQHPAFGPNADPADIYLFQELGTMHDGDMAKVVPVLLTRRHRHEDVVALGVPVLVVAGEHDFAFPSGMLRKNVELLGAEFAEISDAGHAAFFERSDAFNTILTEFLSPISSR